MLYDGIHLTKFTELLLLRKVCFTSEEGIGRNFLPLLRKSSSDKSSGGKIQKEKMLWKRVPIPFPVLFLMQSTPSYSPTVAFLWGS